MNKQETVDAIRKKTAQIRGILRIAETFEFETAFDSANQLQRDAVLKIETTEGMREWIASALRRPLSALSYRRLRDLGYINHVKNYSRLDKEDLIKALEAKGVKSDAGFVEKGTEPVVSATTGLDNLQDPGTATQDARSGPERHQG